MNRIVFTSLFLAAATAQAQQALVLLDPARGGSEGGAHIADRLEEKQVTLATAERLAALLRARGFAVEMTRSDDADTSNDARAAMANTTHPIACVLLHATAVGTGVHLYTTSLHQAPDAGDPNAPSPWETAQAAYSDRSHALAGELNTAFTRSKIPVSLGQTWIRPLDNMQCSAVAVEVSPQKDGTSADDATYTGHVVEVIAGVLLFWRSKVESMTPHPPPPPQLSQPAATSAPTRPTP